MASGPQSKQRLRNRLQRTNPLHVFWTRSGCIRSNSDFLACPLPRRVLGIGTNGRELREEAERDLTRLRDAGLDSRVQQGCHLSSGLTMAAQLLFHRDPKRMVGVLRVTLLNRLNGSREWADLPLSR